MKKMFSIALLIVSFSAYADPYQNYDDADHEIGCASQYSKEKKADLFNSSYQGKSFQWRGEIVNISAEQVSLNMNGKIAANLRASFSNPKAGYELEKGQSITLSFVMNEAGGCFVPFMGAKAEIVEEDFYSTLLSVVGL